ncbi:peptidylprolyl isomerase [Methanobacterium alcaliphilum]|uniref:peptidylprolyl isomerase n=1 Tax=Methanobacterium alcaliphilum TaxID=392018 RepID=UPI00200B2E20|nr:peptidylprolyl isomerase [Methanobacterium alcaliphilum]MCK9150579.1 peptidylprolyl isomerase [Methanobacterium alcaliphilum]
MAVKEGDFIKLEFTGRTKETGEVFDTTIEEVAEEAGIKVEKKTYGPIPVIIGGGHLLKGLDEAVVGMEEGEKKTVELSPEEAFGERDSKLIQLIPMKEFKKQGIKPYVGMPLTVENHNGRIQSVTGGRVRVDFNHELAGKTLEYEVELKEVTIDDLEKIKSMIKLHYPNPNLDLEKTEITIEDGKVVIVMDELARFDNQPYMDVTFARFRIARDIWENMENVEKVEFADIFEKKEEEAALADEIAEEVLPESLEEEKEE